MDAYESLSAADRSDELGAEDLELLATAAYMIGREDDYLALLERAHRAHLDAGEALAAVRCAFWVGVNLARQGEMGRAGGWLARAQRLLEREDGDRVEHGYLLLPLVFQLEAAGTGTRPPPPPARRRRSASGSATLTCLRWRRTSAATS